MRPNTIIRNNQSARLLWYHDHAFGITRINAYAGIASAYIIRDTFEAGLDRLMPVFRTSSKPAVANFPSSSRTRYSSARTSAPGPDLGSERPPETTGSLWYPHVYEKTAGGSSAPEGICPILGHCRDVRRHHAGQRHGLSRGRGGAETVPPAHPQCLQCPVPEPPALRGRRVQPTASPSTASGNPTNAPGPTGWSSGPKADSCRTRWSCLPTVPFDPDHPLGRAASSRECGTLGRHRRLQRLRRKENHPLQRRAGALPGRRPAERLLLRDPGTPYAVPGFGPDTRQIMRFNVGTAASLAG